MILLTQKRYRSFDKFMSESIDGLAVMAILAIVIYISIGLLIHFWPKIHDALFMANEFIKPLWGG